MGTRLMIIRLMATIMIVIASYAVGWYILTRFAQLEEPDKLIQEDEMNNPRLNKILLKELKDEINERNLYTDGDSISIDISEEDPFYK